MKPATLRDSELIEAIDMAAARARLAAADDLRKIADTIAGLAVEAAARMKARGREALRDRCSRLEDAAFHFQTCSTCRSLGDEHCETGKRFAAYLRGDEEASGDSIPGGMLGKVRDVVLHPDGRLTASLEVNDAGAEFIRRITGGSDRT